MEELASKNDGAKLVVILFDNLKYFANRARELRCNGVRALGAEELAKACLRHQKEPDAWLVGHLGRGVCRPREHRRRLR